MLVIILLTIILWFSEPFHGIPAFVITLGALCATIGLGVYDLEAFRSRMKWDTLLFIGIVLGLAPVFSFFGIDTWIIGLCEPYLSSIVTNPYLLVLGLGVLTLLLRFLIVSELAFVNLIMVLLIPLVIPYGINPWIVGMAVYCLVNPWFFSYQNPIYLTAYASAGSSTIRHATMAKYCGFYCVTCLIGLAVSVPFWQYLGLL